MWIRHTWREHLLSARDTKGKGLVTDVKGPSVHQERLSASSGNAKVRLKHLDKMWRLHDRAFVCDELGWEQVVLLARVHCKITASSHILSFWYPPVIFLLWRFPSVQPVMLSTTIVLLSLQNLVCVQLLVNNSLNHSWALLFKQCKLKLVYWNVSRWSYNDDRMSPFVPWNIP